MGKTHPPYAPEFRVKAVKLFQSSDKSLAPISLDLDISLESLRHWVKQVDIDEGRRDGITTEERVELKKLRREVRILKEERDILKKVATFFLREADPRERV